LTHLPIADGATELHRRRNGLAGFHCCWLWTPAHNWSIGMTKNQYSRFVLLSYRSLMHLVFKGAFNILLSMATILTQPQEQCKKIPTMDWFDQ
jgi:hypothetical protein